MEGLKSFWGTVTIFVTITSLTDQRIFPNLPVVSAGTHGLHCGCQAPRLKLQPLDYECPEDR